MLRFTTGCVSDLEMAKRSKKKMNWSEYQNFKAYEFNCRHTGKNKMRPEFMRALQDIRNTFNRSMNITSGYRDFTHPSERLKENYGAHTYGVAADISVRGLDALDLIAIAYGYGIRRVGIAKTFIHLDIGDRDLGFPQAMWTY